MDYVITGENIRKKFRGFLLDIPRLQIPRGFATALVGENGAGKSTLLNLLAGIRLDCHGQIRYFAGNEGIDGDGVRERVGYTGPGSYYLPHWTIKQVEDANRLLFRTFRQEDYRNLCRDLAIPMDAGREARNLSDGNRMKLMLAAVLSRETELLLLDEPASPLDPLMRDRLCDMIREYLASREGERSVFFPPTMWRIWRMSRITA